MKYIKLYEDFSKFKDLDEVNMEIGNILKNFNAKKDECGWTINDINYKIKSFDTNNQIVEIEVKSGTILLHTLTIKSDALNKAILTDVENRFSLF